MSYPEASSFALYRVVATLRAAARWRIVDGAIGLPLAVVSDGGRELGIRGAVSAGLGTEGGSK